MLSGKNDVRTAGRGAQRSLWPLLAVGVLLGGVFLYWGTDALWGASEKKPPQVRVTISKNTTYLTEPLRPDGYPDYLAALNQKLADGVTPENNAAVLFWQAMGPKAIPTKIRSEYFRRLGIPPLPEEGPYFRSFQEYVASAGKESAQKRFPPEKLEEIYTQALRGPWKAEQLPLVAEWLQANEKPLELVVQASRRPRRYDPLLVGGEEGEMEDMLVGALLPAASQMREAVRALQIRAMYRLGQAKAADAWEDLLAIHRLARLMDQGATLVENLVALALENMACQADQVLASEGNLSAQQALGFRDALVPLRPIASMADKVNLGERFMYLDTVCALARKSAGPSQLFQLLDGGTSPISPWAKRVADLLAASAGETSHYWDIPLQEGNQWYDRLVEIGRKPTRQERTQALEALDRQFQQLQAQLQDRTSLVLALLVRPREKLFEYIGQTLVALLIPAIQKVYEAEDRSQMVRQLTLCSFALAAYRAEHGKYPEALADLVPRYLDRVPTDIFGENRPLIYQRTEEGVIMYSVGPNGQDDKGRSRDDPAPSDDHPRGDDLVLRMKTPPPTPKNSGP